MTLESAFTAMAVFGAVAFMIKTVLMFIGADLHLTDGDSDMGDVHVDGGADSPLKSFFTISLQTIFAFFMIGGLGGLLALEKAHPGLAIASALGFGLVGGFLSSFVMAKLKTLNTGSDQKPTPKAGDHGTVYIRIPAGGLGCVKLLFGGRMDFFTARAETELMANTKVEVVRFEDDTVYVKEVLN